MKVLTIKGLIVSFSGRDTTIEAGILWDKQVRSRVWGFIETESPGRFRYHTIPTIPNFVG